MTRPEEMLFDVTFTPPKMINERHGRNKTGGRDKSNTRCLKRMRNIMGIKDMKCQNNDDNNNNNNSNDDNGNNKRSDLNEGKKNTKDSKPKMPAEDKQDVLQPKRDHHFGRKNQHLKRNSRRDYDLKLCAVGDLQASLIYAFIQFLSKILGMKHIRQKDVLKSKKLKLFIVHLDINQCLLSHPFHVLLISTSESDFFREKSLTYTKKRKKVSKNDQLDRKFAENSNHEVEKNILDDEKGCKIQVKQINPSHYVTCQEKNKSPQNILTLNKDVFENNSLDAVIDKATVKRKLSAKTHHDVIRCYKQWNKTGQVDSMQRAWDIILHPPCPFSPGNHNLSVVAYPVVNLSVHRLMRYEILRIRSYNQSLTMPIHSVTQLAQNGFYLSGQDGEVTCFNCEMNHKKFLLGIVMDDTAHKEKCTVQRARKNVGLIYGTRGLTSDDMNLFNTVYGDRSDSGKLFIQQEPTEERHVFFLYTSADKNPVKTQIDPKVWRVLKDEDNLFDNDDNFLDLEGAAYPLFANRRTRKETFVSWDPNHSQKPEELVNLGFFYAGYSDCARCFYCGLGLKYWRPNDDAAYQHARFRPQCKYNQFVKGQDFIDHVQRTVAAENQGANASGNPDRIEVTNLDQLMRSDTVRQVLDEGWSLQDVRAGVTQLVTDLGEECLIYDILLEILNNLKETPSGISSAASQERSEAHDGEPSDEDNTMNMKGAESSQLDVDNTSANLFDKSATESASTIGPDVVLRLIEREHNYLQKRLHCQVCGKDKIGCIYLPCGHVVACQKCGDLASTCILCQRVISAMASIYLSAFHRQGPPTEKDFLPMDSLVPGTVRRQFSDDLSGRGRK